MASPDITTKTCTRCGTLLPETAEFFGVNKKRGRLLAECRNCNAARCRANYLANAQKRQEKAREYRCIHAEKVRQAKHLYYEKHAESIRAAKRIQYQKHREAKLEYSLRYQRENPEYAVARNARYRARKLKNGGTYTPEDIRLLQRSQNHKCWWCGKLVSDDYHVDHRIPLSRGGSNNPENLCISCPSCNMSKGGRFPHEWSDRLL